MVNYNLPYDEIYLLFEQEANIQNTTYQIVNMGWWVNKAGRNKGEREARKGKRTIHSKACV